MKRILLSLVGGVLAIAGGGFLLIAVFAVASGQPLDASSVIGLIGTAFLWASRSAFRAGRRDASHEPSGRDAQAVVPASLPPLVKQDAAPVRADAAPDPVAPGFFDRLIVKLEAISAALDAKAAASERKRPPLSFLTKNEALAVSVDIEAGGSFDLDVVGERNYQSALKRLVPKDMLTDERVRVYAVAQLATDDDNEYDSKAVEVTIDRRTVGYLSREDARRYRRWIARHAHPDPATCRATIVGSGDLGFGVWLDVAI